MDFLSVLQSHPLFETFKAEAMAEVVKLATALTYEPGQVCIHPNEPGEIFGVLISGRLQAVRDHGTASPRRAWTVEPGECFGEMSALTGTPTSAAVVAMETSDAVIFRQEAISRLIVINPEAVRFMTRLITRRLSAEPDRLRRVAEATRQKERPIPIGISVHHVHLTREHVEALFGQGHTLTRQEDLTQPGQFACREEVSLVGPKGRTDGLRVIGPEREQTQVEIARTEEFKLGIDAPIRLSGDLAGTPGITLEGPAGQVHLAEGVICAMRHIHMSPEDAMGFAVRDHDVVRIRVPGERELIFGDVAVRVDPGFRLEMHVDTDEANAAELAAGAEGYLDSMQQRAAR